MVTRFKESNRVSLSGMQEAVALTMVTPRPSIDEHSRMAGTRKKRIA